MKPFPPRLGYPRACQLDPRLSSFPEEGAGETQPFSLQSASCPRRCWCRSGYPHPSLPPFWKHTLCRPATAPAHQRTPRSTPPPRHLLLHPTPYWRAAGRWGAEHMATPLKGAGGGFPPPATAGEEAVARAAGAGPGGARPGRRERAGWKSSKGLSRRPPAGGPRPHSLNWGGGRFLRLGRDLQPRPRPAFPAAAPLACRRVFHRLPPGKGEGGRPPSCCRNPSPHTGRSQILTDFRAKPEMQPPWEARGREELGPRHCLVPRVQFGKCSELVGEEGAPRRSSPGPNQAGILQLRLHQPT